LWFSQVPVFEPRSGIKIAENDAALAQQQSDNGSYDIDRVKNIVDEMKAMGRPTFTIAPLEFEKDDDNNMHMDFIVAASNLRAANYKIAPADKYKVRMRTSEAFHELIFSLFRSRSSLLARSSRPSLPQLRWSLAASLWNSSSSLKGNFLHFSPTVFTDPHTLSASSSSNATRMASSTWPCHL
jgi:ubiquitin-activating enzyme E1